MDKDSEHYNRLCSYIQNTHAATHNLYSLEVMEVGNKLLIVFRDLLSVLSLLIETVLRVCADLRSGEGRRV